MKTETAAVVGALGTAYALAEEASHARPLFGFSQPAFGDRHRPSHWKKSAPGPTPPKKRKTTIKAVRKKRR